MKQKLKLFLLLNIVAFFCISCSNLEFDIEETIKPPMNDEITIQGTWKVEKYISTVEEKDNSKKNNESKQLYVGKDALFDNEIGMIGMDVCINPKYKIIRTSVDTYLQNKYQINEMSIGLKKEDVSVVTITSENRLFYEAIVTDDMKAYIHTENGFLVLIKTSNVVDEKVKESNIGNVGINMDNGEIKEDPLLRSGVLIGIASENNNYRTLWIYSKNREIKDVRFRNQLLVPRLAGFWELGAIGNNGERIFAKPIIEDSANDAAYLNTNILTKEKGKIVFVGNDYFGIENNSIFNVFPIDKLEEGNKVKISDIIYDNSFSSSRDAFISRLDNEKAKNIISEANEENFTIKRRNGHWVMKSRLYFNKAYKGLKYEEFDLNIIVPQSLIYYDEMDIPWNNIKSKLPWITDAYMSPNKDIAILVSSDSLSVYPVKNKSIINNQLIKIPLSKTDSIIMSEWSIGRLADKWGDFVGKTFTDEKELK